jgi:hypothetical protein
MAPRITACPCSIRQVSGLRRLDTRFSRRGRVILGRQKQARSPEQHRRARQPAGNTSIATTPVREHCGNPFTAISVAYSATP